MPLEKSVICILEAWPGQRVEPSAAAEALGLHYESPGGISDT